MNGGIKDVETRFATAHERIYGFQLEHPVELVNLRAVGKIGRALSLDLHQAAQGILDIVNENMFGALRLITVQKGLDPRDFALVAFGGAGPMHANAIAKLAGCYPAIIPTTPGVLSALGFLYSDVKNEFAQTFIRNLEDVQPDQIGEILNGLGRDAKAWLREEGIDEPMMNGGIKDVETRFATAHERIYGFQLEHPVELVNLRAVGIGRVVKVNIPKFERGDSNPSQAVIEQQRVYFDGSFVTANIYDRALLEAGNRIAGPAVILQKDSTTVIHPGHAGEVDEYLSILIRPEGAGT
jgi:N-methylhydantoinase A